MISEGRISLNRLVLSLSDALDYVCREIADHQQRVTYISMSIARKMSLQKQDLEDLFLASALHDIGLIRAEHRVRGKYREELEKAPWHSEMGYQLLRDNSHFKEAARIIRDHHTDWDEGAGAGDEMRSVPMASHIIHLADFIDQAIDRSASVLAQARDIIDEISGLSGKVFNPQCVQAFQSLARKEAFWLDCTSKRIFNLVVGMVEMTPIEANDQTIQGIAEIFARLVDAMSRWTATHSSGVAATAVALSRHLDLSMHDQIRMRTAGLLHDLGKLSVPPEILDHPGKITEKQWAAVKAHPYYTYRILETTGFPRPIVEWASFHHERLDGTGYPFHLNDEKLTLGSRIMAVADIFTALTEVRPYRQGLAKDDAIAALTQMVRAGGIDAEVVNTLVEHFDAIDETRRQEQDRYAERQKALSEIMSEAGV